MFKVLSETMRTVREGWELFIETRVPCCNTTWSLERKKERDNAVNDDIDDGFNDGDYL